MALQIYFNGVELTQYIKVTNVNRDVISNRTNYGLDIPSLVGEYYTGHKYGKREIEVDFAVICKDNTQYFEFIRTLGDVLDTNTPKELIFSDEPNKYYMAVIDGTVEIDKILSNGIGSLTFLCHNPLAYSKKFKEFQADEDGIVTVENGGSAKTQPLINLQFSQDAQFVQVTNYDGKVILIGSRPSVENETIPPNPTEIHDNCETVATFTETGNILDDGREITGSVVVNTGGYGICGSNFGSGQKWHGGAVRKDLKTLLSEFEVEVKMEFDSKGKLGYGGNATTPPNPPTSSGGSGSGVYKCTAQPSLRIRKDRTTSSSKVGSIPYNKEVTVSDVSKGWGKVTYGGKTGFASMDYLKYLRAKSVSKDVEMFADDPSAENRLGMLEVYGFTNENEKLFKFQIKDADQWFEYTDPLIEIGSKTVLSDGTSAPKPQTKEDKDSDGKVQGISPTDSGKYGKFNEFSGIFKIKRTKDHNNNYLWNCEINKWENGKTTERLVSNTLSDAKFPKGELNHLVIFFGQYSDSPVVDTMTVTDIKVTRLNKLPNVPVNQKIFEQGQILVIDCENNIVELEKTPFMEKLDIGSEFFSCGKGTSQFRVVSDDPNIDVTSQITEKWL